MKSETTVRKPLCGHIKILNLPKLEKALQNSCGLGSVLYVYLKT